MYCFVGHTVRCAYGVVVARTLQEASIYTPQPFRLCMKLVVLETFRASLGRPYGCSTSVRIGRISNYRLRKYRCHKPCIQPIPLRVVHAPLIYVASDAEEAISSYTHVFFLYAQELEN